MPVVSQSLVSNPSIRFPTAAISGSKGGGTGSGRAGFGWESSPSGQSMTWKATTPTRIIRAMNATFLRRPRGEATADAGSGGGKGCCPIMGPAFILLSVCAGSWASHVFSRALR